MNLKEPSDLSFDQTIEQPESKELIAEKNLLLQNILNGSLILATILFFINLYGAIQSLNYFRVVVIVIAYSLMFLITLVRNIPYHVRVSMISVGYLTVGLVSMIQSGLNANSLLYFLISVLIIAILESGYFWIFPLSTIAVVISIIGYLINRGVINTGDFIIESNSLIFWISVCVNFLYIVFLLSITFSKFFQSLQNLISVTGKENEELSIVNQNLSERLNDFEKMSDRRKSRLVTTRQISRELSTESDLDKLLHDSVELIRSQLGYYHAGIFLSDDRNENAILRAATGEAGRLMLERKHRIRIREEGIVGFVISRGEPRIAFDVAEDSVHLLNPALPNTRSEIAVPLRVGDRILGALDIQSDQINAFSEEDVDVIQSISDQLATAIDKIMQIQLLKQKVSDLEEGYRSYTRGLWQAHLKGSKKQLSYVYKQDTLGTDFQKSETAEDALLRGEPIITTPESSENTEDVESEVAIPITLRNQTLGVMNIKTRGKTVPADMVDLLNNASNRLALALENARLLEQIQERAEREHLVSEISAKVRASTDIDTILRTAVSELGKTLAIDEVRIQLKSGE